MRLVASAGAAEASALLVRPSLVSVSRALPTARTLRSRSSFATLPHQREIHAFAAFKKGSTAADLSSPSGNHLQPRTVRPTFVPSKLYHVAAQSPRKSSVGLFGLAIGIGLATWAAVSDDSRTLEAKGLAASGRELCMLTRMNDFDGLNRLFPSSGIEPGKDASGKPLPDPDSKHPMGWAAIHVAAANNNVKMVRFWLDHGADVDIADDYEGASGGSRFSSGGVASFESIFDMIKARQQEFSTYLDPRADFGGFTALHYACLNGNRKIIELLLERGADPTRKDHEGRTPREYLDDTSIHDITEMNKLMDDYEKRYLEEKRKRDREMRRKYPLDAQLKEKIVGQAGPIESVASAIRRRENGWHDADKPLVFLFLGSSGIGKTELAKQLAAYLHKGNLQKAFIRLDMSEFQSKHEVAKFIGAPPGYVGYEDAGQLTGKLAACPDAIVLLDEVEKAHPDVLTVMLQLFDEGRLTDGKGTTVSCPDAIFVMTSNLAQQEIAAEAEFLRKETVAADALKNGVKEEPRTLTRKFIDHTIYPILRGHFQRDEFLGRINEILFFLPFSEGELKQLVEKQLQSWQKRAEERHSIKLEWDDSVIRALTSEYNLSYGARSIKHGVERKAINQIARAHEMDEIGAGSTVKLFVDNGGEIRIKTTKPASGGGIGFLSGLFGGNGGKTNGGDEKGKADEGGKGGSQGKGPRIIEIK